MTSIQDVARASGVSAATVSRALRDEPYVAEGTKRKVREAAEQLGYVPSMVASGLVTGRAMTVAVVVPYLTRWFYTQVVRGIDLKLREAHYDLLLLNLSGATGTQERKFHSRMLRKRADAIIALAYKGTQDELDQLNNAPVPTVTVGGIVEGLRTIGIDDHAAAATAVRHLLELGHRRIGHIGGEDETGLNPRSELDRGRAFAELVPDVPPAWDTRGNYVIDGALAAAMTMLSDPASRPTAVFASSDEMAFGVLLAAQRLGIDVPGELSVIGIDDHDFSAAFGLTTVGQDPTAQGKRAAGLVLAELESGDHVEFEREIAPSRLIVRGTTGPAPR